MNSEQKPAAANFRELIVWQKSHELVLGIYRMTAKFPREELFGLTSQMRRSAVSVPANIAEGFVKRGISDKIRFYNISQGSLEELRYYLILTNDLRYADTRDLMSTLEETSKLLEAYLAAMRRNRS